MPTYLLHGFRWHRRSIRYHIILNNLDDAAPEWIIAPATSITLLNSFYTLFDFLPPSHPPSTGVAAFPMTKTKRDMQERRDMAEDARPPVTSASEQATAEAGGSAGHGSAPNVLRKKRSIGSLGLLARPMSRMLNPGSDVQPGGLDRLAHSSNGNGNGEITSHALNHSGESSRGGSPEEPESRFNDWSVVKFIEQYSTDQLVSSQPWAYVADYVVEVKLGVSLTEEMARYEELKTAMEGSPSTTAATETPVTSPAASRTSTFGDVHGLGANARGSRRKSKWVGWFEKLRDSLQKTEEVGWHVVVCEDEDRGFNEDDDSDVVESKPRKHGSGVIKDFLVRRKSILRNLQGY